MSRRYKKRYDRGKKKYTLGQRLQYKAKKTMRKLNRGFEKKLRQTEKNIRRREYSRERYRQWKRREEAQTRMLEDEAGIQQPTTPQRVFGKKTVEQAKQVKQIFKEKSNVDPMSEGQDYLNTLMFGKKRK